MRFFAAVAAVALFPAVSPAQDDTTRRAGFHPEPRYRVDLVEVKARDETGIDFLGSDEIIIWTEATGYDLLVRGFDDMDSGETVVLPEGRSCMARPIDSGAPDGVWSCAPKGSPLPITLTFTVYEQDGVGRAFWEAISGFDGAGFCVSGPNSGDISSECVVGEGSADELNAVGKVRITLTTDSVGALQIGDSREDNLVADACSEKITIQNEICGTAFDSWNGVYRLTLRTTRLPDAIVSDLVDLDVVRDPRLAPPD